MIYRIACVGRIKEQHFTQMLNEYKKEIDKRGRLEICEVPDERIPQKAGDKVNAMIIEAEADRLRHVIGRDDYVIALCIEGKKTTTEGLADQVRRASVNFYIGYDESLTADMENFSLCSVQPSAEMTALLLSEQTYRAYTILNNITYHK